MRLSCLLKNLWVNSQIYISLCYEIMSVNIDNISPRAPGQCSIISAMHYGGRLLSFLTIKTTIVNTAGQLYLLGKLVSLDWGICPKQTITKEKSNQWHSKVNEVARIWCISQKMSKLTSFICT